MRRAYSFGSSTNQTHFTDELESRGIGYTLRGRDEVLVDDDVSDIARDHGGEEVAE